MKTRSYNRYGEAFKLQVVEEIGSGKFSGPWSASRAYGINGAATVSNWLRRYGREDLIPTQTRITTVKERDEKTQLQQRVRQLEKALADAHMLGLLNESYLEIACERLDIDPDAFKKKHVSDLSGEPARKEKK